MTAPLAILGRLSRKVSMESGPNVEAILNKIPNLARRVPYWMSFMRPPPKMSVSEWADKNRVLTSEDSPETGKWRTETAPFQREMMDAIGDPTCEQVVLMCASQTGKTAGCVLNTLGYFIDVDPCPILLVYPSVTMAEKVSRQRISPMIRNCPSLRKKIYRTTWRGMDRGSDSLLLKSFQGGMLVMGGAEKPDSLSSFPMRVVLLDEIDRYKQDVGTEGDPIQLAITRASNFWNRKIILSSTPTIHGSSRIEFAYGHSSQGHWNVQCPSCFEFQELKWEHIDYSSQPGKILAGCQHCGTLSSKARWLNTKGKWFHKHPERKIKGYHVNAIVSPWVSWETLVNEWIQANNAKRSGNTTLLKVFLNTRLAETFFDYAVRVESHMLYERRELYEAEIPDGVLVLTVGADVQDIQKRINYEIVGWGHGYESWGIEYGTILADPREKEWQDVFDSLVFNRIFRFANGKGIRVRRGLIDANGSIGPYIYRYTKKRQPRIYSCKGSGHELPTQGSFTGAFKIDNTYNTMWYPINTVMGKDEMFQRLLIREPGPAFCHFPCGIDEEDVRGYSNEFFIGLTSEQKHEDTNNLGYTVYKYKKEGASHQSGEPLDCRNYARAALELIEQNTPLAKYREPDYLKGEGIATTATIDLTRSQVSAKTNEINEKTREKIDFNEEISENRGNPTKSTQNTSKHPLFGKFGTFGSINKNFDPFQE
jgi:phage terminase large subunit GpA-like protein